MAGNHDITLEVDYYNKVGYLNYNDGKKEDVEQCNQIAKHGNNIYLEDKSVELCGITFYGSPYQPAFHEWAFNRERGEQLAKEWRKIPSQGIDVLLTHGPPKFHGDGVKPAFAANEDAITYYGDEELLKRVMQLKDVQFHVFGHVHEGFGCTRRTGSEIVFINASTLNSRYYCTNKPIMMYVQGKKEQK